jgi:hypothetical protein
LVERGKWTEIPAWLKNVEIEGFFDCSFNKLTSLKNCPRNIEGYFTCSDNELTSLEGCPENIRTKFICFNNKVKLKLPGYAKLVGDFLN